MPKILMARPPRDAEEQKKIRKLARARHAPADWTERARIVASSWEGKRVPAIAAALGCHDKKMRPWVWGRPQPKPRTYRRRFVYAL